MDILNILYLSRYAFVACLLIMGSLLLKSSLRDFGGNIRAQMKPVKGYFLMSAAATDEQVASFSLYHTTTLGSARGCDIRIRRKGVEHKHAVIYLFNRSWYIAPSQSHKPIIINGFAVTEAIPLENKDKIVIGDMQLIFVNERLASYSEGLEYSEDYGEFDVRDKQTDTFGAWFFTNCYMIAASLLVILAEVGVLAERRPQTALLFGVYIFVMNLYYFVLPLLLPYVDKAILLASTQLCFLGIMLQTRFVYVAWNAADLTPAMLSSIDGRFRSLIVSLFIGLIVMPLIVLIVSKTSIIESLTTLCAIAVPLILVILLIFGRGGESHGASLWLNIGSFSIQLTEFVKIFYLIVLASFFKNRPPLKVQLLFAGWAAVVFFMIMMLPDLGSIMILLPTTLVVFFVMTSEYLTTTIILLGGSAMSFLAYAVFPYVQRRIAGWTTLWVEVNDQNRQIVHGLQSVARGGFIGVGLGNGVPESVPQYMDDMIFDALCEELGLITGLVILFLFIVIWLRSTRITMQVRDGFTSSLILGIGTAFFAEAAVVIAGNLGLMPLTGVTLPFIASGGSSLLAKFMMLGILLGLGARREEGNIK